jgi:hypothetical protein
MPVVGRIQTWHDRCTSNVWMARLEPVRVEPTVPTVSESLDRMVDAAQNVLADEMRLLRAEAITSINTALRSAALMAAGTLLLGVGWIIALMAVFQVLAPRLGTLETLGVLIAANVLPGVALVLAARRRTPESRHG